MRSNQHPSARFLRPAALIGVAALTLVVACNEHDKPITPTPPSPVPYETAIADSLVFTRAGSSTGVSMGNSTLVCCGLYDPGFVNERAMRIVLHDPALSKPGWDIVVLVDRATAGAVVTLPTVVVPPSKVPAVSLFVADGANELSSDDNNSAGTITVHSFSCDGRGMQIYFSVDGTLGSELAGGPTMDVHGAFRASFPPAACP